MLMFKALSLILLLATIQNVVGHGRLRSPPSRATCWREGFPNPADYNDNQGFCGGATYQQSHGGKCGICGDPWMGPKPHEVPGKYANGIIVETYEAEQEVQVTIQITANHKGYFEFKLCPNNNIHQDPQQDCFDSNLLEVVNGDGNKFMIGVGNKNYYPIIKLPNGLTCSQCILQWTYITGNSWACDPVTGECCVGCNPLAQEHFRACADFAISRDGGSISTNAPSPPASTTSTLAPSPPVTTTTSAPGTTTPPTPATTTTSTSSGGCKAAGPWSGQESMNNWCVLNCNHDPPYCPPTHCIC